MEDWYVRRNGETLGPIAVTKLKGLAADSQIGAETEVRLGTDGQWVQASTVEGLFDAMYPSPNHPILAGDSIDVAVNDIEGSEGGSGESSQAKASGDSATLSPLTPGAANAAGNPYQPSALPLEQHKALQVDYEQGLRMTRAGLLTCYYGICSMLLGVIGSVLVVLVLSVAVLSSQGTSPAMLLASTLFFCGVVSMGGTIVFLVGQIMCLAVPVASDARGYVMVALAMHIVWLILAVVGATFFFDVNNAGGVGFESGQIFSILCQVSELVGFVCFVAFLKKIALYLGQLDLASAAQSVMRLVIGVGVIFLVLPLLVFVFATAGFVREWFSVGIALIAALSMLVALIRFANLLVRVARAIPKHG